MLEIPRNLKTIGSSALSRVKVLGVGNAGVNLVDRLTIERSCDLETVAINTDLQSLVSSVADSKISIGEKATRGLGTGGDPEIGADAAHESQDVLYALLKETALAIVCAGLGGGTGSSVLPVLLEAGRAQGTLTTAILTLPFHFEGRRRMRQATDALECIRNHADAILIFENDRMSENVQPGLGIGETFAKSDLFLTQAAIAIARLVSGSSGPLQLTLGDLATVLRPNFGTSLFGFGQAEGEDRAATALKRALENPLTNYGGLLNTAERLLIHIDGPSDLLLSEVQTIVQEISASNPSAHLLLGFHVNSSSKYISPSTAPLIVSLLGTCPPTKEVSLLEKIVATEQQALASHPSAAPAASIPAPQLQQVPVPHPISAGLPPQPEEPQSPPAVEPPPITPPPQADSPPLAQELSFTEDSIPVIEESHTYEPTAVADDFTESKSDSMDSALKPPPKPKQEILQFEPIARGRFEKSEPTIVDGEDIDVPTFLRMKIKVK